MARLVTRTGMKYTGIDLRTTNRAICTDDGKSIYLYWSPDRHGVTPSAISMGLPGRRCAGSRTYNNAPHNPGSAATDLVLSQVDLWLRVMSPRSR